MNTLAMIALDLVAISILALGLYFPRHHRADLVAAFLGVNVGVLAVAIVLVDSSVGMGLGLGLFGVLSIIRLRSSEISQHEVAYYFAALAIGLISGMTTTFTLLTGGLIALVLAALAVGDSPRLFGGRRSQLVQLDRAIADEGDLRLALADLLGGRVTDVQVVRLDLVNDLTLVEARYLVPRADRVGGTSPVGGTPRRGGTSRVGGSGRASVPGRPQGVARGAADPVATPTDHTGGGVTARPGSFPLPDAVR